MYADNMTDSMKKAIEETQRRRALQEKYNEEHGITPQTIKKAVRDLIAVTKAVAKEEVKFEKDPESMGREELEKIAAEGDVDIKCHFCGKHYNFTPDEVRKLIEESTQE